MDIVELSRKFEGDLLESKALINSTSLEKSNSQSFSPTLTRSRAKRDKKITIEDCEMKTAESKKNEGNLNDMENINLNKKSQMVHKNLETIYEHPIWKKGNTMFIGTSKVKRSIYLNREFRKESKQKSKLRKIKIKKLGKKFKPFKMTDDEFKNKMLSIENYINDSGIELNYNNKICDIDIQTNDNNQKTEINLEMKTPIIVKASETVCIQESDVQMLNNYSLE